MMTVRRQKTSNGLSDSSCRAGRGQRQLSSSFRVPPQSNRRRLVRLLSPRGTRAAYAAIFLSRPCAKKEAEDVCFLFCLIDFFLCYVMLHSAANLIFP